MSLEVVSPPAVSSVTDTPFCMAYSQMDAYARSIKSRGHPESTNQMRIGGLLSDVIDFFAATAFCGGVRTVQRASAVMSTVPTSQSSGSEPKEGHQCLNTKFSAYNDNSDYTRLTFARSVKEKFVEKA